MFSASFSDFPTAEQMDNLPCWASTLDKSKAKAILFSLPPKKELGETEDLGVQPQSIRA